MRNLLLLLVCCWLVGCSPKKEEVDIKPAFDSLLYNYHQDELKLSPLSATNAGDNRYNDLLPNQLSAAQRQKVKEFYEGYAQKLTTFDRTRMKDGRMALWTREDNVTRFDGIEIRPLPSPDFR